MRALLPLLLLAAGCASTEGPGERTRPAEAPPAEDGARAMAATDLRVEADRLRVVVPLALADDYDPPGEAGPPWTLRVGAVLLVAREIRPEVLVAGESFSVEADGIVKLRRRVGQLRWEEGPFRTVLLRDGRLLRR